MNIRLCIFAMVLGAVLSSFALAQDLDETPPQEAPFVQEDNEFDFDDATSADAFSENSIPVVEVAPAPIEKRSSKTVRSNKGGVEYIHHPQAEKGLTTITKEGAYIYRTSKPSFIGQSASLRFGMMDSPRIEAADGTTFTTMYSGSQTPVLNFDFEWQPFESFGKLGAQLGLGLIVANGNGRFLDPSKAGMEAKEKYTFIGLPLNLGVTYRLQLMDRQWIAPYVSGGGSYIGAVEIRDDEKSPSVVGTPGAYGSGGLLFNITALDKNTSFTLSSEYGISNLWVAVEYRYMQTFNEDLDFSSNIISAGVVVDY